jgi:hypothetical protein
VEENFTSTKMAEALLQVYQETLAEPCMANVPAKPPLTDDVVARPAKLA